MTKVYENPVFQMADVNLKFSKPEARININRDKASIMGVSTKNIAQTLQYGERTAYGLLLHERKAIRDIGRNQPPATQQARRPERYLYPKRQREHGAAGQPDRADRRYRPPKLYRYNRFVSATISAGLADGKTIGQGLDEMDKIAKETLDETFRTALTGDSKEYRESSSSLMFAFILAIVLIYLILPPSSRASKTR